ncbi:type VII secretion integral membrane protein EccD [Mycolicibacterium arabiense]|uniref:type VII secretion integral membrane protein EccD n=1 Tax=Mycolicibacterium arabiense TaxID=1286181 RepID=UPI0013D09CC9|nr:type VII secretion integral membrane protein EccD [Mycolicibacterium arabiense]MCV7376940.1 type VII secretion integral membrane protein EccD [Mycolicibacterium arabiense]
MRLSLRGDDTQVDVALPLDIPIASLTPLLVELMQSDGTARSDEAGDGSAKEGTRDLWVLRRSDADESLVPDATLRDAGVIDGELLSFRAMSALTVPTLFDDVVDAAAQLNKAAHVGWGAEAARAMTFAAVTMASAAWIYFLLSPVFAPNLKAITGVSIAWILALVGAGALANRTYGQRSIGAALGWAALPIAAAMIAAWAPEWGVYGLAAGCLVVLVLAAAFFRIIGSGRWGYLTAGGVVGLTGVASAASAAGIDAATVGVVVAVASTLACRAVPHLTSGLDGMGPRPTEVARPDDDSVPGTPLDVWERVREAVVTRSALYTALSSSAGLGAAAVLLEPVPLQWPAVAFALGVATALALYAHAVAAAAERMGLGIPAVALVVLACWRAQGGDEPMPVAAFALLLVTAVAFVIIGARAESAPASRRMVTVLAYLNYLSAAALIPLAAWAIGCDGSAGAS